jgi:hypothetical protein
VSLHETFLRSFLVASEGAIAKAVTQMLVQKMAAKGIVLTKKQQARILAGVRAKRITSAVASLKDVRLDTLVALKVLNQLGLETIDAFVTVQRQLETAEDRRRRRNLKAHSKRQRRVQT